MRQTILVGVTIAVLCANLGVAYGAPVETITLRSGEVASGVPGLPGNDDVLVTFNPNLVRAPTMCASTTQFIIPDDFDDAVSGPKAKVILPLIPTWFSPAQMVGSSARWINFGEAALFPGGPLRGAPGSALYAVPFMVNTTTITSATIQLEGGADDTIGDTGNNLTCAPNPDGVYINGTALVAFASGAATGFNFAFPTTHPRVLPAGLIVPGLNYLYFYQRDTGAFVSGLIFSATITVNGTVNGCTDPFFLVIDEESIDNGNPPNYFSATDVNDHIARVGLRSELPYFAAHEGETITLHTGTVGDEGWFAPKTIPPSWNTASTTSDGLRNYILAGPGLGSGRNPERFLDKVPDVTPLRATGLKMLEGSCVCAVVYDSDVSINYGPLNGSLKGANLGLAAFEVQKVTELTGYSSGSLPKVEIEILDATEVCNGMLTLFSQAPEPTSSSEPYDTVP